MGDLDEKAFEAARVAWLENMSDYTGLDKATRAAVTAYLAAAPPSPTLPSREKIEAEILPMTYGGADLTECVDRILALFNPPEHAPKPSLDTVEGVVATIHKMTPEEIQAQRESFARAMKPTGDPRFD